MALTPDLPFPKGPGDPIRSKDWNDHVNETRRLDIAKVDRTGDAMTGSLSVAGTLAVNKPTAGATARLDVAGDLRINDSNLHLRGASDVTAGLGWFGTGKLFATAAIDGPVLWGNAGGALGSGVGAAQRVALRWDSSGNVAIGVPAATLRVEVGDRIRLRQGASGTAGLFLFQATPNADRAFVGMADDNTVGLANAATSFGLRMNVSNLDVSLAADLAVAAEIRSPRFKSTTLMISRPGPLPLQTQFTSSGGTLLVFASGSGFRGGNTAGVIGMTIRINGVNMATNNGFTNEGSSHRSFPSAFVTVTSVDAGTHTLQLVARDSNTLTDFNDFFNVTILELPFRSTGIIVVPVPPILNPIG